MIGCKLGFGISVLFAAQDLWYTCASRIVKWPSYDPQSYLWVDLCTNYFTGGMKEWLCNLIQTIPYWCCRRYLYYTCFPILNREDVGKILSEHYSDHLVLVVFFFVILVHEIFSITHHGGRQTTQHVFMDSKTQWIGLCWTTKKYNPVCPRNFECISFKKPFSQSFFCPNLNKRRKIYENHLLWWYHDHHICFCTWFCV